MIKKIFLLILVLIVFSCDLFVKVNQSEWYKDEDREISGHLSYKDFYNYSFAAPIAISPDSKNLYACSNGNVVGFDIDKDNGYLSNYRVFMDIDFSYLELTPDGRFLYASDTTAGLMDVYLFKRDLNTGNLSEGKPLGLGFGASIFFTISPDGRFLYVNDSSAYITKYEIDQSNGTLKNREQSDYALPPYYCTISSDGKSFYFSNGTDLCLLELNPVNGDIVGPLNQYTAPIVPMWPAVSEDLRYLFIGDNSASNEIFFYKRDLNTGKLSEINSMDIGFLPYYVVVSNNSRFLYATTSNNEVLWFRIKDNELIREGGYKDDTRLFNPAFIKISPNGRYFYVGSENGITLFERD